MPMNRGFLSVLSMLAALTLVACDNLADRVNPPASPDATPTPSASATPTPDAAGNPPVGVVNDTAGFYVSHFKSTDYTYVTHKTSTDPTQPCIAAKGERADCYIEAKELDLYYNGVTLQYNVPSNMCEYLGFRGYWYYKFATGLGPVYMRTTTDNTVSPPSVNVVVSNTGPGGPFTNIVNGQAPCNYDFSKYNPPGPNCCLGTYQADNITIAPNPAGGTTTTTTSSLQQWGGDASKCIGGPYVDDGPKSKDGYPIWTYKYINGTGVNATYVVKPPLGGKGTDIYPSNFVDPADYPAAAGGFAAGLPVGLQAPPDPTAVLTTTGNLTTTAFTTTTGDTTLGSNLVANLASTAGLTSGMIVTGAGIPPGTTIVSVTGTTAMISNNATGTATGTNLNIALANNLITGLASTAGLSYGLRVVGNGVPPGTFVTGVSGNTITVSQEILIPANGVTLDFYATIAPRPDHYFRFQCLDRAGDILAEIVVQVRKWNTGPEFDNWLVKGTSGTLLPNMNSGNQVVLTTTGDITTGSNQIANLASVVGIGIGQVVTGPGIPPSTRVTAYTNNSITMTHSASSTTVGAAVSFANASTEPAPWNAFPYNDMWTWRDFATLGGLNRWPNFGE